MKWILAIVAAVALFNLAFWLFTLAPELVSFITIFGVFALLVRAAFKWVDRV